MGVSVGGMGVDVGDTVGVGGRLEGTLVLIMGVLVLAQPTSARIMKLNKSGKAIFLIILSSIDQSPRIITREVFVYGYKLNKIR